MNSNFKSINFVTIIYALFSVFLIVLGTFVVLNSNWVVGDQLIFLKSTAIGKPLQPIMLPSIGRFYPLGFLEYNILFLLPFGFSALSHYLVNLITLLVFSISIFIVFIRVVENFYTSDTIKVFLAFIFSIFIIQRVYCVFLDVIFTEKQIVTLFSMFMLLNIHLFRKPKWFTVITSVVIVLYSIFLKEPVFGLFFIFFFIGVIALRGSMSRKLHLYFSLILISVLVFVGLYVFVILPQVSVFYQGNHGETDFMKICLQMIWSHKVIVIALLFLPLRFFSFFVKRNYDHFLFDAFLFSVLAYFFACLYLKLNFSYYYLPGVVFITPSVLYFLLYYLKLKTTLIVGVFLALFYIIKFPTVISSNQQNRKSSYPTVSMLAKESNNGLPFYWIKFKHNDNSWDDTFDEFIRSSYEVYIAYLLKDECFSVKTIENANLNELDEAILCINPHDIDSLNHSIQRLNNSTYSMIYSSDEMIVVRFKHCK